MGKLSRTKSSAENHQLNWCEKFARKKERKKEKKIPQNNRKNVLKRNFTAEIR